MPGTRHSADESTRVTAIALEQRRVEQVVAVEMQRRRRRTRESLISCERASSRPKRLIVSWNACGERSSSAETPIASPSSTNDVAGNARASVDDLGQPGRHVVQVAREDRERRRRCDAPGCAHRRASTRPTRRPLRRARSPRRRRWRRASVAPDAALAGELRASASAPPVTASAAVSARSPPSIAARRTVAAGTPAACAIASAMSPASAP